VRSALFALLVVFLAQSAVLPIIAAEDCVIQEIQHSDDDCSPLCVLCVCNPVGHSFQTEIVRDITVCSDPSPASVVLTEATLDAPPREILHVPLVASAL
jgi:hypothetical protein